MELSLLRHYPKQNHKCNTYYYQPHVIWTLNSSVETFAQRLLYARQQRGLTQEKLAKLCSISQSTIASYENGSRLHARNLIELAHVLHVTPKWLRYGEGSMHNTLHETSTNYDNHWPFVSISPTDFFNLPAEKLQLIESVVQTMIKSWNEKSE